MVLSPKRPARLEELRRRIGELARGTPKPKPGEHRAETATPQPRPGYRPRR